MGGPFDGQEYDVLSAWEGLVAFSEGFLDGKFLVHIYVASNIIRDGRMFYLFKETSKL